LSRRRAHVAHDTVVATVERIGDTEDGSQCADDATRRGRQGGELRVRILWGSLSMVTSDLGDDLDLFAVKAQQLAVGDEIVGVALVVAVADVVADVVHERGELEPLPRLLRQGEITHELIEQAQSEARDMGAVFLRFAEMAGEARHAAVAHVGVTFDLGDALLVAGDEIEQHAFAQRPGACDDSFARRRVAT
jgi:hypothetical protein